MVTSAAAVSAIAAREHVLRAGVTCADVDAVFSHDRARSSVLVALDDGECLLVDRGAFYEQMCGPLGYGRTLHLREPVSAVIEPRQVVVDADEPLEVAALRAATSGPARRSADVLVRYASGWGTVPLGRLLHHLRDVVRDHAAEIARVHAGLHEVTRCDALTGIANRTLLFERTADALASVEHGTVVSLVHCDVDRFTAVNDTLGHTIGDDLLVAIARRLQSVAGVTDLVARSGGDEFVVLTVDDETGDGAGGLAERVLGQFARPFDVDGHVVHVRASVGVVTAAGASDASTMLSEADGAMRAAKAAGGDRVVRSGGGDDQRSRRAQVVARDLRTAVARDQLHLVFQPIVRTVSGEVVGVEALLRWEHPELGPVPPNEFIAVAEAQGLIGRIGHWVLETACRTLATWDDGGAAPAWVAVNFSAFQLDDDGVAAGVADCLRRHGLRPDQLHVELTESVMATGDAHRLDQLRELRDLGVAISLDDFGTGYSSLSALRDVPLDVVKIDRSFVTGLVEHRASVVMLRSIVDLAHALGHTVVAEGVERPEELEVLQDIGCDQVQGYLLGRPVPAPRRAACVAAA